MKRIGIVNVNLEYKIPDCIKDEDVEHYLTERSLPQNYVCESFEIVKIIKEGERL